MAMATHARCSREQTRVPSHQMARAFLFFQNPRKGCVNRAKQRRLLVKTSVGEVSDSAGVRLWDQASGNNLCTFGKTPGARVARSFLHPDFGFRNRGERESLDMNRFFSKLNLSDIKIKAEGNSFPPDADEVTEEPAQQQAAPVAEAAPEAEPETFSYQPEPESMMSDPEPDAISMAAPTELPHVTEAETPVASNGHSTWTTSLEETTTEYEVATDETHPNGHVANGVTEIHSEGLVVNVGDVLKVSSRSRPSAVAGAIAGVVREVGKAEVQAIGAGATNQAIKAVAIARDYLEESGIEAICVPAFIDVSIENENRTAIRLLIEPR